MSILHLAKRFLSAPEYFRLFSYGVIAVECVLTLGIIQFIRYTEIDWSTYMQQVEIVLSGERNYALIEGSTGPLVYPAGHVYVYTALYYVTDYGTNILRAQYIFAGLYLATLFLVFRIYGKTGDLPQWSLLFIALSKRLHSIYVLRLFNDPIAVFFLYASVLALIHQKYALASVVYGLALSIKMNILLYLPGYLFVYFVDKGAASTVLFVLSVVATQLLLGQPFLSQFPREYVNGAFEFSRQFMWKWTVNWRWVGKEMFQNATFQRSLLVLHLILLVHSAMIWSRRYLNMNPWKVVLKGLHKPLEKPLTSHLTPHQIVAILFTSNLIGICCARSLHYQFYSWYAHQLVFFTAPSVIMLPLLAAVEYAWNVFPSTPLSSLILVTSNFTLLITSLAYRRYHTKKE